MTDDLHTLGPYVLVPVEEYEMILLKLKGYEQLQRTLSLDGVYRG
jgi:hypothetical protein